MKHILYFLGALIVANAHLAHADCDDDDDRDHVPAHSICEKAFVQALQDCHASLSGLRGNTRAQAEKACVKDAKIARRQCFASLGGGTNACQSTCTATYNTTVTNCQTTFDPNSCNGDTSCQALMTQNQADCITQANTDLNTCTSACPTAL